MFACNINKKNIVFDTHIKIHFLYIELFYMLILYMFICCKDIMKYKCTIYHKKDIRYLYIFYTYIKDFYLFIFREIILITKCFYKNIKNFYVKILN